MCNLSHDHHHDRYGFIVDTPEVRALIDETQRQIATIADHSERIDALKPAFAKLLAAQDWLPDDCAIPDERSRMGDGIGQYALYRADDGSLCLFSLVIPADAATPVHDHLAWGIVGVYRGEQDETVYARLDDGDEPGRAELAVSKRQALKPGDFYALIPPTDDIHYVKTTSTSSSISIHLLANDTACVWRHKFDPSSGVVTPFRSGYANAPCPSEVER